MEERVLHEYAEGIRMQQDKRNSTERGRGYQQPSRRPRKGEETNNGGMWGQERMHGVDKIDTEENSEEGKMKVSHCLEIEEDVEAGSTSREKEKQMSGGEQ